MLALLLAACAGGSGAPEATSPPTEAAGTTPSTEVAVAVAQASEAAAAGEGVIPKPGEAAVPTMLGEVAGVTFVGDWTSPPCGGRTYARNVHFEDDQQYAVIDLVSPCPVGTTCVWSGMTTFSGLWEVQGTKLKLQEIGGTNQPGGPHPAFFEATPEGTIVENGCTYTRGLTVPTGYAPERVTPKIPGRRRGLRLDEVPPAPESDEPAEGTPPAK